MKHLLVTLAKSAKQTRMHVKAFVATASVGVLLIIGGGTTLAGFTATAIVVHQVDQSSGTASALGADTSDYPSLAETFNNIGTTDNTAQKAGNFDLGGYTYSRQDLIAQGWTPGQTIIYAGAPLVWPNVPAEQSDNTITAGQIVGLSGQGETLTLLAAADHGPSLGTVVVTYTDDSTTTTSITVPDWVKGNVAQDIISMPHRNNINGTQQSGTTAQIFPINIHLDNSKTVASVTLPAASTGKDHIHIFAMGIRPTVTGWTASWGNSSQYAMQAGPWTGQTLRMAVHASVGGAHLRLRFENTFNNQPVTIGHASVAIQLNDATAKSTPVSVTFNGGNQSVTMPAGTDVASDPVAITIPANAKLLVSEYLPSGVSMATVHANSYETEYTTKAGGGDHTMDASGFPVSGTFSFTTFLAGVDIQSTAGSIVTLGDSITDGSHSITDADTRWPDYLSYRLGGSQGVVNEGIGGNSVTLDAINPFGAAAINREYRDVISIPGAKSVILLEGINDIRGNVPAAALESGLAQVINLAHQYGIKVYVSPILPFGGVSGATTAQYTNRMTVNAWIRAGSSGADGVLDLSAAVTGGGNPEKLQANYDGGDHLHPNSGGYNAMANAIDLSLLN